MAYERVKIIGPPGTGKTTRVTQQGGYLFGMAMTNQAARQTQRTPQQPAGRTVHSALRLASPADFGDICRRYANDTLWLDEAFQVPPYIMSLLVPLGQKTRLVITGDPDQCGPLAEADGRLVADDLNLKGLFMRAVIDRLELLTVDHRNDHALVALRDSLLAAPDVAAWMAAAIRTHPTLTPTSREEVLAGDHHLCFGNGYRHSLNAAILAARGLVFAPPKASSGLWLRARATRKAAGYSKHDRFELLAGCEAPSDVATLRSLSSGAELRLTASELCCFEPAYAGTIYSAQGSTITAPCFIHQAHLLARPEHRALLYTAVTRCVRLTDVRLFRGLKGLPQVPAPPAVADGLDDGQGEGLTPFR